MKMASLAGDAAWLCGSTSAPVTGLITSIDADGFSLGTDVRVNESAVVFDWLVVEAEAGDSYQGTYVGNVTDNRNITGMGCDPAFAIIASEGSQQVYWRTSDFTGDITSNCVSSAFVANHIQAMISDGIQIGSTTVINASGVTHHVFACEEVAGIFKVFTYTGDGTDSRSISGFGFQPDWSTTRRSSAGTYLRTSGNSGDQSGRWASAAYNTANLIQLHQSDGIQIGSDAGVNNSGSTFYGFAFRAGVTHAADVSISCPASLAITPNLIRGVNLTISGPVTLSIEAVRQRDVESTISGSVTIAPNAGLILQASLTIHGRMLLSVDHSEVPTGRLSAGMLAQLAGGRALAIWLLEMDIAGTTHRLGFAPYSSRSGSHYSAGLLSLDPGTEIMSDREGRLSTWEAHGEFEDTSRVVAGLLNGADGDSVLSGPARVLVAHPKELPANWFTARRGFVARLAPAGALKYAVDIRPNDAPLRAEPHPGWRIDRVNWPNASDASIGKTPVAAYGTHDGGNLGVTRGLLPAHLVDTAANIFVLCRGWAKSVTRVCSGDTTLTLTSDYVISQPLIKGRRYTVATMTAATWNDTVVTWDGEGIEDSGSGGGSLIEGQLEQLSHALSNFYFDDYMAGAWLPTAEEIDEDSLATVSAWLSTRGVDPGALAVTDVETGEDLIARVLLSTETRAFWNNEGKIYFHVDENDADPYDAEVVDWRSDDLGEMTIIEEDVAVVAKLTVEHAIDKASGEPLATLEVQLPGNDGLSSETLTLSSSATE